MYRNTCYLVETEWLSQHLVQPNLRLFDVTGMLTSQFENLAQARSYAEAHIPGAAFLDVASGSGPLYEGGDLPWMASPPEKLRAALGEAGVGDGVRVVVYAASPRPGIDRGAMWATRAWWMLDGVGVDCAVLNGGFEKWVKEGRPIEQEATRYAPMRSRSEPGVSNPMASKEDVLSALADESALVVDSLSKESFAGTATVGYGKRKGHIDGAVNLPMDALLDEDGCFLPEPALRQVLQTAGLLDASRVITYCGGGIAATVDAFALKLLGYDNVSVYDASLFEWANDPALPMVSGGDLG